MNRPIFFQVTGNLVSKKIRVAEQYIQRLPMDEEIVISGTSVTLVGANQ